MKKLAVVILLTTGSVLSYESDEKNKKDINVEQVKASESTNHIDQLSKDAAGGNADALEDLIQLAKGGEISAQVSLSELYYYGFGVKQDYAQAFAWAEKAAEAGDLSSQYNVCVLYLTGQGVSQDESKAFDWCMQAAKGGNVDAQYDLSVMFRSKENITASIIWGKKAASGGNLSAAYNLGLTYELGEGVEQDYKEAVKWYEMAAKNGDVDAQINLGALYYDGTGVEQNDEVAKKWFSLAAAQGSELAKENLDIMKENKFRENVWIVAIGIGVLVAIVQWVRGRIDRKRLLKQNTENTDGQ